MLRARTLHLYIGTRFLTAIVGTFLLCSLLIFMIDVVELLRQAGKYGRVPALTIAWMALLRLPAYTEILLPFCVLVGAIGALLFLNRKSELAVMRAAGMSAWQFMAPGAVVAFVVGLFAVGVYNPVAVNARLESERRFAEAFGREMTSLRSGASGAWLRQDGADGPSVINAASVADAGRTLRSVMILQYDTAGHFSERIDGASATLADGHWRVEKAVVSRVGREPEQFDEYAVSTYLTPERAADALGTAVTVSFWELPGLIEVTEKAKLSSHRFRIQYELLLSRPLLLLAMVLLGATVSLRSFRSGGTQTMVIAGMIGGFAFFLLSEVSRQIGVAGLAPPVLAVWVPVVVVYCGAVSVLLHQEDG